METWILVVLLILFLVWRMKPIKGVDTISVQSLKNMLNDQDKVFVDVRTSREFNARHIPQFQNIPLGSDFSKLPKDKEIVVICQSGVRSKQACQQLKKLGYEKVTNVRGGMSTYR